MASEKKITMREYNGTDYDTLYPKTIAEQVDGIYSNDEVLSNSTKALYGLTDSAVPDNVLSLLSRFQSGLGNEYVWAKTTSKDVLRYREEPQTNQILTHNGYSLYYSDEITAENNAFVLVNPQTITVDADKNASYFTVLRGKYFSGNKRGGSAVRLMSEDATFTYDSSFPGWRYSSATYMEHPYYETITTIYGYVNSPDPNAYPPAVSDGYTYKPMGQIGAKVQIATGSYTGTATYGSSNPNSLTFDFEPKLIFVQQKNQGSNRIIALSGCEIVTMNETSSQTVILSWKEKTVAWYSSDDSGYQLNGNTSYLYLAIG